MPTRLIVTGDVNLMKVADPAEPFRNIGEELRAADVVFGNLECCLHCRRPAIRTPTRASSPIPVVGGEALGSPASMRSASPTT